MGAQTGKECVMGPFDKKERIELRVICKGIADGHYGPLGRRQSWILNKLSESVEKRLKSKCYDPGLYFQRGPPRDTSVKQKRIKQKIMSKSMWRFDDVVARNRERRDNGLF